MFIEHISAEEITAGVIRFWIESLNELPVELYTTASGACLIRGRNGAIPSRSAERASSSGLRACRCRIVTPAPAASIVWAAMSSWVHGSAPDIAGVWIPR